MWCQRREWSDWPCRTAFYAAWSHWKWCLKAENQFLESKAFVSAAIYWAFEITRINAATKGQSLYQDKVLHSRENTLRFALPELPKCPTQRSCKSLRNWEICINKRNVHGFEMCHNKILKLNRWLTCQIDSGRNQIGAWVLFHVHQIHLK